MEVIKKGKDVVINSAEAIKNLAEDAERMARTKIEKN